MAMFDNLFSSFSLHFTFAAEATGLIVLRIFSGLAEGVVYPALTDLLAAWVPLTERTTLGSFAYGGSTVNLCQFYLWVRAYSHHIYS